jgi:hypothetical protein
MLEICESIMDRTESDRSHQALPGASAPPNVLIGLLANATWTPSQMLRLAEAWRARLPQAAFATVESAATPDHLRSCLADRLATAGLPPARLLLVGIGASARQALALAFAHPRRICRGILAFGACPLPDIPANCDGTGMQIRLIEGHEGRHVEDDLLGNIVRELQGRRFDVRAAMIVPSAVLVTPDAVRLGGAYIADMVATSLASPARLDDGERGQ